MSMTIQSSVKDKILATSSETSKVENAPAEMLRDLDQQMEKRADDGKANVVTDALSRKERVKPRRVRAMAMTIQYGMERKGDESLYFMDQIWVLLIESNGERPMAFKQSLEMPEELRGVHDTFHVSTLKKCLADASLHVPLDEIKIDKTLCFVEEPVKIMDREVKSLKRSSKFACESSLEF
ncbi:hypothetical protein Tco_0577489 [Tanacetum coccineum]